MKLERSRQIIEKSSNIKFRENPSKDSRMIPYVLTDVTMLSLFVIFRKRLKRFPRSVVSKLIIVARSETILCDVDLVPSYCHFVRLCSLNIPQGAGMA
jgi:hypothetical protein